MSDESSYYSGKKDLKLDIDFENSRVDILGSDVVITSPSGERKVLPGLGVLFLAIIHLQLRRMVKLYLQMIF